MKTDSEPGCGDSTGGDSSRGAPSRSGSVRSDAVRGDSVRGGGARGAAVCREPARVGGPVADGGGRRALRPTCEMVTVPERQGLETVDILRLRGGCGAVLLEDADSTLSFLVPFGTAAQWQLPGSSCRPMPARGAEPQWLLPPAAGGSSPALTDPTELRAALGEATRTLAASDRVQPSSPWPVH